MFGNWTWVHTLLLLAATLAASWLIWEHFRIFTFFLVFVPPVLHLRRNK